VRGREEGGREKRGSEERKEGMNEHTDVTNTDRRVTHYPLPLSPGFHAHLSKSTLTVPLLWVSSGEEKKWRGSRGRGKRRKK